MFKIVTTYFSTESIALPDSYAARNTVYTLCIGTGVYLPIKKLMEYSSIFPHLLLVTWEIIFLADDDGTI